MIRASATDVFSKLLSRAVAAEGACPPDCPSEIERLTANLARGDEAAFREFHTRYFNRLYQFLLAVTRGSDDETQEALQLTLLRVTRHARVFQSEEVFWSWLKALARSAACDGGRKRQRYTALLLAFASTKAEDSNCAEPPLQDMLRDQLKRLPAEDQLLLTGKYVEGYSVRELADLAGLTEKAVESRLVRLRRLLRERVLRTMDSNGQ